MISVFNLEALQSLLRDFYEITRIRITVFDADMRELVSWPEQSPPFCRQSVLRSRSGQPVSAVIRKPAQRPVSSRAHMCTDAMRG